MPQAFQPSETPADLMNDTENKAPSTPQPTSTKHCPPQESTQETTASVSEPRTPAPATPSTETIPPNPDLIDLTEREFPDETAETPECGTVTPTPVSPTEGDETPNP
jgi:hypothetical protein